MVSKKTLHQLNKEVTKAIYNLEAAERKVSFLEEQIAHQTSVTSVEGMIARRGAISAAIRGRNEEFARQLLDRYLAEDSIDATFAEQLKVLFD